MPIEARSNDGDPSVLAMAADIVSAYVSHNPLPASQIPDLIQTVYGSLSDTGGAAPVPAAAPAPAAGGAPDAGGALEREALVARKPTMPIEDTIQPEYLVCLEDGKHLKMLKRHLRTAYGLSPADYRAKWGLPPDYPMVAPSYSKARSEAAKKNRLGHKRRGRGAKSSK